jgi:hypothetical protein
MRKMQKYSAATPDDPGLKIEIQKSNQIIKAVVPFQSFRAAAKRKDDLSIV